MQLIRNILRIANSGVTGALFAFASVAFSAPTPDVGEAGRLYQQGKLELALVAVDAFLTASPKDAQGRFLRGLILTDQRKTREALLVFAGLAEDFPELPEPYNNLAVLFAGQGDYDKARAALELAVHAHPTYATAFENLGDIYAQLARRAYEKALQLETGNASARAKLASVTSIFARPKNAGPTEAAASSALPQARDSSNDAGAPAAATARSEADLVSRGRSAGNAGEQVAAELNAWATSWAAKDVTGYLSHYAPAFEVPDGLSRASWEAQRKERLERAARISVEINNLKLSVSDREATAVFRQAYRSDRIKSDDTKTIKLVRRGERWLIVSERSGP